MRPVVLGTPPNPADQTAVNAWLIAALREIERASYDDTFSVADDMTLTNISQLRSLDASSASLANTRNFLATFINDMKKRGQKRNQ